MGASGPPGRAEGAVTVWFAVAKDEDAGRDERECEKRTDVGEVASVPISRSPAGTPTTNPATQVEKSASDRCGEHG